jgi:hypothetical protein
MKDIEKEKLSFSQYVRKYSKYVSLREMFYNYIIAREGELPQSDEECRDEIEDAIAIYFGEENKKSSTKVQIKPEDFYLSLTVEDNKVLDFDIVIEHMDKPKIETLGTFLYLWLECGGSMTLFFWVCLGIVLLALGLSAPYCVTGI